MRELVLLIRINDAREQINGGFCKKLLALIDGGKLDLWQCGINDVVKAEQGKYHRGIEMPYSSAACNTPSAMESVEAKIAVAEQPFANSFRLSAQPMSIEEQPCGLSMTCGVSTCFFHHFGKAAQTKLVRQAVGALPR